jgi:DNA-directed RNA polymerase specialized sigma subunit
MSRQGKVGTLPQEVLDKKQEVVNLRYVKGMKQQEIAKELGLRSQSYVAELLRMDIEDKIRDIGTFDPESTEYKAHLIDLVVFMRDTQHWNYKKIAELLGVDKYKVFEIIREYSKALGKNTAKIRYSLTNEEKKERNNDLVKLSQQGYSVTEIASKVYLSKQRVSSIFSDMGFVPIKGRNLSRMESNENTPELVKLVIDDCNVKLDEISKSLQQTKDQYAMYKYSTQKQVTQLRCTIMTLLISNKFQLVAEKKWFDEYVTLRKTLRTAWTAIKNAPKAATYEVLKDINEQINEFESSEYYKLNLGGK